MNTEPESEFDVRISDRQRQIISRSLELFVREYLGDEGRVPFVDVEMAVHLHDDLVQKYLTLSTKAEGINDLTPKDNFKWRHR